MLKDPKDSSRKSSSFPRDTLQQAETVRSGWAKVGTKLVVPNLDLKKFASKLSDAKDFADRAEQLKRERAQAIQDRNQCLGDLWDLTKRIRNSAKATFGDYSKELEILVTQHLGEGSNDSENAL